VIELNVITYVSVAQLYLTPSPIRYTNISSTASIRHTHTHTS